MTRFLAYTNPLLGHLYPIVPTLLELRRRGHEVVLCTGSQAADGVKQPGLRVRPVDPALERIENDDWKARTPVGAQKRDVENLVRRARLEVPDLERAIEAERPQALLVDVTAFGASAVAERSGLPWAHAVHFPAPVPSRDVPPYGLGLPPRHDAVGRVRDAVARRLVLGLLERTILPRVNELRSAVGLRPLADATDYFGCVAPLVLYYSAEPFEYPRSDWPPSFRLVGPGAWDPPAESLAWLDDVDRPLVLVTCSSDFQNDGKLLDVALAGLADEDVFVVATTAGVDPGGFRTPANARVERYLPHGPLLERAACVVCHAGMGITQKALAAGVPVCAVPFGRDQFEVARRVQVAAAGVMLPKGKLSPKRLRRAVREAISNRAGATRVAAGFSAAGGAGAAADALEKLAGSYRADAADPSESESPSAA
ncbi:MAG TPA: nucleotide disphospho-sugar-binding domain-containing protein [Solirubrobacterales bacterium]|nr:nucleotide disphospho-sugar-binding domain-containing protein [Solirubrobacterales bacterium]